jgi:outer membrane protein assembly factor BamB/orotate phosphoribosyltransferase
MNATDDMKRALGLLEHGHLMPTTAWLDYATDRDAQRPVSSADANIERLFNIVSEKSIIRQTTTKVFSPRGTLQSWLIDLRKTFFDAEGVSIIADLFWDRFADQLPFQVGGLEVGAVPLTSAIQLRGLQRGFRVNGFVIRKERKHYGLNKMYEGELTDEPVVVVDDLLNSAGTAEKVRVVLAQNGLTIRDLFVVIDYQNPRGTEWVKRHGINFHSIYSLPQFRLSIKDSKSSEATQAEFEEAWQFTESGGHFFDVAPGSTPTLDDERLYFGSESGDFWALDLQSGLPAWTFRVTCSGRKQLRSSPAIHRDRVYFGAYDGNVYCLDAATGKEHWRFTGADWVGSSPSLAPELDMLFIGLEHSLPGQSGGIAALRLSTGEKIWEFGVEDFVHGSPVYDEYSGFMACGTNGGELLLFEPTSSRPIWRFMANDAIKMSPAFDRVRNAIIVGTHGGLIHSVDLNTGKARWTAKSDNVVYSTPLVVGDRIYVTSTDKHAYVLNANNGRELIRISTHGKNFASPRLIDERIYFGSTSGLIYEFDPALNSVTGQVQLPERLTDAVVYSPVAGLFYAKSYDGKIYAFRRIQATN